VPAHTGRSAPGMTPSMDPRNRSIPDATPRAHPQVRAPGGRLWAHILTFGHWIPIRGGGRAGLTPGA
jgi:hypothetical protein